MRNTTSENIAEHSHLTAVLAHAIAVIGITKFGRKYDPNYIAAAALYHDCGEVLTGDLPTPVKYSSDKLKAAYKDLEESALDKLLGYLPKELVGSFENVVRPKGIEEQAIIKAADKISAYIKCIEETEAGNKEFGPAYESNKADVEAIQIDEVKYFLEHFLGAFRLSLDELG